MILVIIRTKFSPELVNRVYSPVDGIVVKQTHNPLDILILIPVTADHLILAPIYGVVDFIRRYKRHVDVHIINPYANLDVVLKIIAGFWTKDIALNIKKGNKIKAGDVIGKIINGSHAELIIRNGHSLVKPKLHVFKRMPVAYVKYKVI